MGNKGTQTSTRTKPHPEVLKKYLSTLDRAEQVSQTPFTPYGGQMVAGFTPMQTQGFQNINDIANADVNPVYETVDNYYNPYQDEVVNATMANLNETFGQQRNALKGDAISKNAFGGDRAGIAEAELSRNQGLAAGQTIGGLRQQGYTQALQTALADRSAMLDERLKGTSAQVQAGTLQQANEQEKLNKAYEMFMREQRHPYENIQFLSSILGGLGPSAGGTATNNYPGPSMWSQILGGGTTLMSLLSDERAKENIIRVGTLDNGTPIYAYNYKGDPQRHFGPIAQEVEEINPDAVTEHGGLKYVNVDEASRADGGGVPSEPRIPSYLSMVPDISPIQGANTMPQKAPDKPKDDGEMNSIMKSIAQLGGSGFSSGGGINIPGMPSNSLITRLQETVPAVQAMKRKAFEDGGSVDSAYDDDLDITGYSPVSMNNPSMGNVPAMPSGAAEVAPMKGFAGLEINMPLLAAGLGMLASRSPHAGVAIGEGGLAGVQLMQQQQRQKQMDSYRNAQIKRMEDAAEQARKTLAFRQKQAEETNRLKAEAAQRGKWSYIGTTEDGTNALFLNSVTGETESRPMKIQGKNQRVIPSAIQKDLGEKGETFTSLNQLGETFKPEYGGWKSNAFGDMANYAARNLGVGNTDGAAWWQNYDRYKAQVRNKLYGAALSRYEIAQWEKADITPGMTPEIIQRNLDNQKAIVQRGLTRRAKSLMEQGYSQRAIEAELGMPLGEIEGGAPYADGQTKLKPTPPNIMQEAKSAIESGKPRDAVINRLRENGYDPEGL